MSHIIKKKLFNMSIIQICERREEGEQQQQQAEQYDMVHLWEAGREMRTLALLQQLPRGF